MNKPYRVVQVGLGRRGQIHMDGFLHNPDQFTLVGVCNRSLPHLQECAEKYKLPEKMLYTDPEAMMAELKPDVLCFSTMPHDRLELVRLAAKYKVKGLMMEKPIGVSLKEAKEILDICEEADIKTIVCHQHKYLRSFQRLAKVLEQGELGRIYQIQVQCQQHANQIATHYIDYMLWANRGSKPISVIGHTHGTFYLEDSHPSPDYIFGEVVFDNGVRGLVECGYFSPAHQLHDSSFSHGPKAGEYYTDNRLTVYGEYGYAYAECNGGFKAFTKDSQGLIQDNFGPWSQECLTAQDVYTKEFADWLDDDAKVHPCDLQTAYDGYQVLEAIYISALENRRVDLPLQADQVPDSLERQNAQLPPVDYRKFTQLL